MVLWFLKNKVGKNGFAINVKEKYKALETIQVEQFKKNNSSVHSPVMNTPLTTRFLVLRKTAYSETSLIVAGLSPDHGQLHFLVRGGRRIGKKQSPVADLFRILDITFRPRHSGLLTWSSAELDDDFTAIAANYPAFDTACKIAKFALTNCPENDPQPRFFHAVATALARLCEPRKSSENCELRKIQTDVAVAYLAENGLLPDTRTVDSLDQANRILRDAECAGM